MAVPRRISIRHREVFPHGAYLIDGFEALADWDDAKKRSDGTRPQMIDPETELPVWTVTVVDADPEVTGKAKSITVKVSSKHQPVPPENKSGTPFTLVEFSGLTITPWVDDGGMRPKQAYSFRATGIGAPGQAAKVEKEAA